MQASPVIRAYCAREKNQIFQILAKPFIEQNIKNYNYKKGEWANEMNAFSLSRGLKSMDYFWFLTAFYISTTSDTATFFIYQEANRKYFKTRVLKITYDYDLIDDYGVSQGPALVFEPTKTRNQQIRNVAGAIATAIKFMLKKDFVYEEDYYKLMIVYKRINFFMLAIYAALHVDGVYVKLYDTDTNESVLVRDTFYI